MKKGSAVSPNMADHPGNKSENLRTGILLVNLGTPEAPTKAAVRRYLAEFLWDPRIVPLPRPLWWLVLHGIILNRRPKRSAEAYRKIWTPDGSPLLAITNRQAEALETRLAPSGGWPVAVGMRYGSPSIATGVDRLEENGCGRILVLPLYPQYSTTTTASAEDALAALARKRRTPPEIKVVQDFHDHPGYLSALAGSVENFWRTHGRPDKLLMSFHGMPRSLVDAGDPYEIQCRATADLLAKRLRLPSERWALSFQSRFGRAEWIQPYTDATLRELPGQGVGAVDLLCPGFPTDCLETLEEIAIQNRVLFLESGGRQYRYIPALNDDPAFVGALADICRSRTESAPPDLS